MAGAVREAKLDSAARRSKLKRGRQPHWHSLIRGRAHLGYQCWPVSRGDKAQGRWLLRRYLGSKYAVQELALADDLGYEADGETTLSFEQARYAALAALNSRRSKSHHLTVGQVLDLYVAFKQAQGQSTSDVESRGAAHILPSLGDIEVADLTSDQIRKWLSNLSTMPAMVRSKLGGKQAYKDPPADEEAVRRRRASANRVLTMLKAALNHAYDEGHVSSNEAWGRRVKPFKNVERARVRYLSVSEARRLINSCDPSFRLLVQGALQTGARYSELARMQVFDFNPEAGTVAIQKSKAGQSRHVMMNEEGVSFFKQVCAGRLGHELIFQNQGRVDRVRAKNSSFAERSPARTTSIDNGEWRAAEQVRLIKEACTHAKLYPSVTFHGLRHTWASLSVMNGVPLIVVAKNLGHKDTRMVERHYGHLAPSYIADAIRNGAPKFGFEAESKIAVFGSL